MSGPRGSRQAAAMSSDLAQSKRIENLHLTRERDRRRGRELATFVLAATSDRLRVARVRRAPHRDGARRLPARVPVKAAWRLRRTIVSCARSSLAPPLRNGFRARPKKGLRPPHPGQLQFVEARGGVRGDRTPARRHAVSLPCFSSGGWSWSAASCSFRSRRAAYRARAQRQQEQRIEVAAPRLDSRSGRS